MKIVGLYQLLEYKLKFRRFFWQIPQIPSRPQILKIFGKLPKSGSTGVWDRLAVSDAPSAVASTCAHKRGDL